MQGFLSNRVEILYDALKERLFQRGAPFVRRLVVVPSPAMKSWLTMRMAEDPDLGVSAGLEVVYLDESIDRLLQLSGAHKRAPKSLELGLAIESEVKRILNEESATVWEPLRRYLHFDTVPLPQGGRRLVALADTLAKLYQEYGLYGGEMLVGWEAETPSHWQALLWKRLYQSQNEWSTPHKLLYEHKGVPDRPLHVHLFAISYLAPLHFHFLQRFSREIPVDDYLLSPCMTFWSDQLTDHQQFYLQGQWERHNQTANFQTYFEDRHTLLANLGKLGRERVKLIEENDVQTDEAYYFEEPSCTLLHRLQSDMGLLSSTPAQEKQNCEEEIPTIQLHRSPTKLREAEVLYDTLMRLIDQHQSDADPIQPHDIVVMTPDIQSDAPFIQAVFGRDESALDFQIMDLEMPSHQPAVRAFLHLLALPKKRWEITALLTLIQSPSFQEKHQLSGGDVDQWKKWILSSGIRWGYDQKHQQELLLRDHCPRTMQNRSGFGTWSKGMDQLLRSLVESGGELEFSQGDLLGKGVELLQGLYDDLKPLETNAEMPLKDWAHYLICLAETYLDDPENIIALACKSFKQLPGPLQESVMPFSSVLPRLEAIFSRQHVCYREGHLHSVRFCAFLPMRAIPAKVIVLMGMDEEAFPRRETPLSLNLLEPGLCPSVRDYDRFLFLEALLSARDYFVMSYVGTASDGKEQSPSTVISELMQQLDRDYLHREQIPSVSCEQTHPFLAFDARNFEPGGRFNSYSKQMYRASSAYYHLPKVRPTGLISSFSIRVPQAEAEPTVIDLQELSRMARNPIQAFFNHRLGIWLNPEEESKIPEEEPFMLQPIERAILKKGLLKDSAAGVLARAEQEGLIPQGPFFDCHRDQLIAEMEKLQAGLWNVAGDPQEFYRLTFHERVREPVQDDKGHWSLPPLEVELGPQRKIVLVGQLETVSPKGLVTWHLDDRKEVIKGWPQYLLYRALKDQYGLPGEEGWIMGKSGVRKEPLSQEVKSLLSTYLIHHQLSLKNVSPMLPEWIPGMVEKDESSFQEEIKRSLSTQSRYFYNHYMRWMGRDALPVEWDFSTWKKRAIALYGEMYEEWYPKRGGKK